MHKYLVTSGTHAFVSSFDVDVDVDVETKENNQAKLNDEKHKKST